MFYSIDLNRHCSLPLVAHSTWNESADIHKHGTLFWLFSSQEQILNALDEVKEGRAALEQLIKTLPQSVPEPAVRVKGDAAASLSASVAILVNNAASVGTLGSEPELGGFWSPPWANSSGIIIWRDFKLQYHVAVVWTKEQALFVLSAFNWMNPDFLKRRREEVQKWTLSEKSEEPIQFIDGIAAYILFMGSLFKRVQSAISRKMN